MATMERHDRESGEMSAHGRAEPQGPGFRGGPRGIRSTLRGDARAAVVLALVIVAATIVVLGVADLDVVPRGVGGFLGLSLEAGSSQR